MTSLPELLAAAAGGDASAKDSLATRLLPDVRRLVHVQIERRLRRPGDAALARLSTGDVVQEVLLEILRGLDRWDISNEEAFIGMVATLVEHRLTDQLRYHQAKCRDVRRHDNVGAETAGITDDRTPSRDAVGREQRAIYREVLATFSDRERTLLSLRLHDKVDFKQLAQRLGFPTADAARKAFETLKCLLAVRLQDRGLDPAEGSE